MKLFTEKAFSVPDPADDLEYSLLAGIKITLLTQHIRRL